MRQPMIRSQISAPLMSRFAVIEIPDYTAEEKKVIFFKVCAAKSVEDGWECRKHECIDDSMRHWMRLLSSMFAGTSGIRDLEQAAEHIAANALYQIEANHVSEVIFDAQMVRELLV